MRRKTARFTMYLLIALLFTSIFIPSAFAADFESEIKLEDEETFSLTASELQLFDFENFAPGDIRTGKLHIKNTTDRKMDCRILSIISYAEDKSLFNAMALRIMDENGTELYSGPYGRNDSELIASITVKPMRSTTLDLEVSFPASKGNEYQAAEMDSIWTFEASVHDAKAPSDNGNNGDNKGDSSKGDDNKGETSGDTDKNNNPGASKGDKGPGSGDSGKGSGAGSEAADKGSDKDKSGVKTGLDLTLSDSGLILGLILVVLCFLAAIVTSIRVYAAKRKQKDQGKK